MNLVRFKDKDGFPIYINADRIDGIASGTDALGTDRIKVFTGGSDEPFILSGDVDDFVKELQCKIYGMEVEE